MNYLSLFTGVGGGDLAFQHLLEGFRCVGYVEYEKYCQDVIRQRIEDGFLDCAPIFGDIREFNKEYAEGYKGMVDLITGGFPCQDISTAKGPNARGIDGEKSGLWKEMRDTFRIIRPEYGFMENSPALTFRGLDIVIKDLAKMGYDAKWGLFSAGDIGARHERQRIWICANIWNSDCNTKMQIRRFYEPSKKSLRIMSEGISSEPRMGRKADDLPYWMDRLKAIGNGQVPIVAATAWEILS